MTTTTGRGRGPPGQPLRHQGQDPSSKRALAPFWMNTVASFSVDTGNQEFAEAVLPCPLGVSRVHIFRS